MRRSSVHKLEVRHRDNDLLHFISAGRCALVAHVRQVVGLTPWARHSVMNQLVPHVVYDAQAVEDAVYVWFEGDILSLIHRRMRLMPAIRRILEKSAGARTGSIPAFHTKKSWITPSAVENWPIKFPSA